MTRETLSDILKPRLSPEVRERADREYKIVQEVAAMSELDVRAELVRLKCGPEPRNPDSLTDERLKHHFSWNCEMPTTPPFTLTRWLTHDSFDLEVAIKRGNLPKSVYPCRNGNPWEFATWEEIDGT